MKRLYKQTPLELPYNKAAPKLYIYTYIHIYNSNKEIHHMCDDNDSDHIFSFVLLQCGRMAFAKQWSLK